MELLLGSLRPILASSRPNDSISEELAELIGFHDIELVMEILSKREEVLNAVGIISQSCQHESTHWHTESSFFDWITRIIKILHTYKKTRGKARQ